MPVSMFPSWRHVLTPCHYSRIVSQTGLRIMTRNDSCGDIDKPVLASAPQLEGAHHSYYPTPQILYR